MRSTRAGLRRALGALWVVDGLLQLQPYMFGRGFADDILAPTAGEQPGWVAAPINLSVSLLRAQPILANATFAAIQLLIGIALLLPNPRLARPALVASITWALGVWWLGEGLGGLAGGHTSLVAGFPGAAALYALLSAAALPPRRSGPGSKVVSADRPPRWVATGWALVWVAGALFQLLPGQRRGTDLAAEIATTTTTPTWLNGTRSVVGGEIAGNRLAVPFAVVLFIGVGLGVYGPARLRCIAAAVGSVIATLSWALAQGFGSLTSGEATDPNTGVLLLLFAATLVAIPRSPVVAGLHRPSSGQFSRRGRSSAGDRSYSAYRSSHPDIREHRPGDPRR